MIPELTIECSTGDSLDLMDWNETPHGPVLLETLAKGTEWGNPESARTELRRALADGSALAVGGRASNRTVNVKVRMTSSDALALAAGEAILHRLVTDETRRCELRWTPPDGFAPGVAFLVARLSLSREYADGWDLDEAGRACRTWALEFECLPFVRSIDPVVVEAVPQFVATPVTLDDCSSTVGWSGMFGGATIEDAGDSVRVVDATGTYNYGAAVSKPLTLAKRYLAIEATVARPLAVVLNGSSGVLPLVGTEGGWYFYDAGATAITQIWLTNIPGPGINASSFTVHTIAESDAPRLTPGRQSLRVIDVPGSARTDGVLTIRARNADDDGTGDSLGTVIAYMGREYDPRLSPYSLGSRTADTAALSGSQETSTYHYYERPLSAVPAGNYVVYARARVASAGAVSITLISGFAPQGLPEGDYVGGITGISKQHTFTGTTYELVNLGTATLPGVPEGQSQGLALRLMLLSGTTITVDELLIFNRSAGRLLIANVALRDRILDDGDGTYSISHDAGETGLWVDGPTLHGDEAVVAGSIGKDMAHPLNATTELTAYDGPPIFTPEQTFVYVATTGTIDPAVSGTFRPAWHSHPAQ